MDENTSASEKPAVDPHTRKTITLTHKQAGVTGIGVTTIFTILHFLSANYASKSDAKAIAEQLTRVEHNMEVGFTDQKTSFATHIEDETTTHRRIVDTLRADVAAEKSDRQNGDEIVSKRIDLVMELFKIRHTETN